MNFFSKRKKQKDDKVYLKYKNGKVIEYRSNEEIEAEELEEIDVIDDTEDTYSYQNKEEKDDKKETSKKFNSKILIWVGLLIIIIPLVFMFIKSDSKYISKLTDFMITGKMINTDSEKINEEIKEEVNEDKNTNEVPKNEDKEDTDEEDASIIDELLKIVDETEIEKINPETLVVFNNIANKNISNSYKYLKVDLNNFSNAKESIYFTEKNLSYKRKIAYFKYEKILGKESLFLKSNQQELFILIRDRYANYINCIDSILENLSRNTVASAFNEALKIDNELLSNQTTILKNYLDMKETKYIVNPNEIILE